MIFGFDKNGRMTFRIHSIDGLTIKASDPIDEANRPGRLFADIYIFPEILWAGIGSK